MINKCFLLISFVLTTLVSLFCIKNVTLIWLAPVVFVLTYLSCMIVLVLFMLIVTLPINKKKTYDKYSPFYHRIFTLALEYICNLAGVKVEISGLENLPKEKQFMLVSNHRSRFDPMITCYILSKYKLSCVSKPSNFKVPLGGGKLMARDGYIAIDRKDNREGAKAIARAVEQIKSKEHSICIYPEGMRNIVSNSLLDFRNGCFKIAMRAGCPIVVMTIDGTESIKKNFLKRESNVKLDFVGQIQPNDFENTEAISTKVRSMMEKSLYGTKIK